MTAGPPGALVSAFAIRKERVLICPLSSVPAVTGRGWEVSQDGGDTTGRGKSWQLGPRDLSNPKIHTYIMYTYKILP